jgi:hypothetical protein
MVVRDTVNPTDCALTSQKHTSRPQVFDRGRYAMQAAATVQRMLATVAVIRRASNIVSYIGRLQTDTYN